MANAINWFEIPVTDYDRAKKFYESILDVQLSDVANGPVKYGFFPHDMQAHGASGSLVKADGYTPSDQGSLVYLTASPDLTRALDKVEGAGGKVIMPKTAIGENGFIAHFQDTEGNRVALHSVN